MITDIYNKKILLQYSGGKDSTACLLFLKKEKLSFEAIHYVHSFSYEVPTQEAKRICKECGVNLHIVNIDSEIKTKFLNNYKGRPCRVCKSVMDSNTVEYAQVNGFDIICVGDTKSDTMLVNRLNKSAIKKDLSVTKYFNKKVNLPDNIWIYRPLIDRSNDEVLAIVKESGIKLKRVNDTGDKYFEYSREGCPLQFKDYGVKYSLDLMEKLKKYNTICSEFATQTGIRATIHLPSEFIVTIPKGYEKACRKYLEDNGCRLSKEFITLDIKYIYSMIIPSYNEIDSDIFTSMFSRLFERMNLQCEARILDDTHFVFSSDMLDISVVKEPLNRKIYGLINSNKKIDLSTLNNIIIEIFHTSECIIENMTRTYKIKNHSIPVEVKNCRYLLNGKIGKKIIRSSTLDYITEEDMKMLKEIGVAQLIDLRQEGSESVALNDADFLYNKICFMGEMPIKQDRTYTVNNIKRTYSNLLIQKEVIKNICKQILSIDGGCIFFCKYGRDRTGIVSALLELLIKTPVNEVVSDFMYSDLLLNDCRTHEIGGYEIRRKAVYELLNELLEKYKVIDEYFLSTGLSNEEIESMKNVLLDR